MKKLLLFVSIITYSFLATAQNEILGKWHTEDNKSVVEVYKKGDVYFAKVLSLKDGFYEDGTPKIDKENSDKKLQKRPVLGLEFLTNMRYDTDEKEWTGGKVYDPESGNTYSGFLRLENPTKLYLRGYIGFSWIGRTSYWTRSPQ